MTIKITLVFIVAYFLYSTFKGTPYSIGQLRASVSYSDQWIIGVVLLLMPVNWLSEAGKWKLLVAKMEPITLWKSVKVVLMGLVVGFFTPAKIGDISIKYMHVQANNKRHVAGAVSIGRFAQFIITLIFGGIGLLYLLVHQKSISGFNNLYFSIAVFIGVVLAILSFFNLGSLFEIVHKTRFSKYTEVFKLYSKKELLEILLVALFRYAVFTIQFVLMLIVFDLDLETVALVECVFVVFLIKSIIPFVNILGGIGLREAAGVLVFGMFGNYEMNVLIASLGLWFCNIVLPCLAGLVLFVRKPVIK